MVTSGASPREPSRTIGDRPEPTPDLPRGRGPLDPGSAPAPGPPGPRAAGLDAADHAERRHAQGRRVAARLVDVEPSPAEHAEAADLDAHAGRHLEVHPAEQREGPQLDPRRRELG